MSQQEIERMAFEDFASLYPHEAAELDWPKFVAFVRERAGKNIKESMIREMLRVTA